MRSDQTKLLKRDDLGYLIELVLLAARRDFVAVEDDPFYGDLALCILHGRNYLSINVSESPLSVIYEFSVRRLGESVLRNVFWFHQLFDLADPGVSHRLAAVMLARYAMVALVAAERSAEQPVLTSCAFTKPEAVMAREKTFPVSTANSS